MFEFEPSYSQFASTTSSTVDSTPQIDLSAASSFFQNAAVGVLSGLKSAASATASTAKKEATHEPTAVCKSCESLRAELESSVKRCQILELELSDALCKRAPAEASSSDAQQLSTTVEMLQIQLEAAQRDTRIFKQRLLELESENMQLRESAAQLEADHSASLRRAAEETELSMELRLQNRLEVALSESRQRFEDLWAQREQLYQSKLESFDSLQRAFDNLQRENAELKDRFEICVTLLGEKTDELLQFQQLHEQIALANNLPASIQR